jgi:hypothetical protein
MSLSLVSAARCHKFCILSKIRSKMPPTWRSLRIRFKMHNKGTVNKGKVVLARQAALGSGSTVQCILNLCNTCGYRRVVTLMPLSLHCPARQAGSDHWTKECVSPRTKDGLENGKRHLSLQGIKSKFLGNHICSLTAIKTEYQPTYITSNHRVTTA